jgi:hypothetical protein
MPLFSLWLAAYGCSCSPALSPSTDESTSASTGSTSETADSAPPALCASPEVEPNDQPDVATPLTLEQWGCGLIAEAFDPDHWVFTLQHDAWLKIEIDAANGSIADLTFLLDPLFDTWAAYRPNNAESVDTTLIFPAPAGDYDLLVTEETLSGGERYGYDVLVSEAKPAAEWSSVEVEPNDAATSANPIASGAAVFGTFQGNGALEDFDYYVLLVPAGKHTVHIDVDAFDVYSSADVQVLIKNEELVTVQTVSGDPSGEALDPLGTYESAGSEVLYIQVLDQQGAESPARWYVLNLSLEAS